MLRIRLVRIDGLAPDTDTSAEFGDDGGTIGRAAACTLVVPDPARRISGVQAQVTLENGQPLLWHQGHRSASVVGTRVLVEGTPAVLSDGDRIFVGPYELLVEFSGVTGNAGTHPGSTVDILHAADGAIVRRTELERVVDHAAATNKKQFDPVPLTRVTQFLDRLNRRTFDLLNQNPKAGAGTDDGASNGLVLTARASRPDLDANDCAGVDAGSAFTAAELIGALLEGAFPAAGVSPALADAILLTPETVHRLGQMIAGMARGLDTLRPGEIRCAMSDLMNSADVLRDAFQGVIDAQHLARRDARAAADAMLDCFDPSGLGLDEHRSIFESVLPGRRKALLWDALCARYGELRAGQGP